MVLPLQLSLPLSLSSQESSKAGDDDDDEAQPEKHHTYSYWAVDFPRAFDMVQLRLHVMKRLLKVRVLAFPLCLSSPARHEAPAQGEGSSLLPPALPLVPFQSRC